MKKSRFTDEQIALALKQAETGTKIGESCRKIGTGDATFYKLRQKYGGLVPSDLTVQHLCNLGKNYSAGQNN